MLNRKLLTYFMVTIFTIFALSGCASKETAQPQSTPKTELAGDLTIYHAGSLSIPFEVLEKEFELQHPKVDIKRTSGGSVDLARKVSELGDSVDILASADYTVIDNLLIPDFAKWNALFARNTMVIMYTDKSKFASEINANNWYDVLLKKEVNFGHSEPNADPCGYRTILLWQLAEKHYEKSGLYKNISAACPEKNIRPKAVELISLLETGVLDYAFEYESVAMQHSAQNPLFKYLKLPEEINFGSVAQKDFYKTASIDLKGKNPGEVIKTVGEPIVYSLTMPSKGKNTEIAYEFLKFLFDKNQGMKILAKQGQPVLEKVTVTGSENLPEPLKAILK